MYYTFSQYLSETTHDYTLIAPSMFNNGFNINDDVLKRWISKNNLKTKTSLSDNNFIEIYDYNEVIAVYHQYKGKIYTDKTIQELTSTTVSEISENVNEAKDHIIILTLKDGSTHKSQPMEYSIAKKMLPKILKSSKKEIESSKIEKEILKENINTDYINSIMENVLLEEVKLLEECSDTLNSLYNKNIHNPKTLENVLNNIKKLL